MSEGKIPVNEAGLPIVQGPTFLYSSAFNAHQAQSLDQAASNGELERFLTLPMVGAGLVPYGVAFVGSPLLMASPYIKSAVLVSPFSPYLPAANEVGMEIVKEVIDGSPGYTDVVELLFSAPSKPAGVINPRNPAFDNYHSHNK